MRRYIYCVCLVALMSACGHHHSDAEEHEHHHHENTVIQQTAYGTHFELYAEATPFCAGKPSSMLCHLTWLDSFKPLTEGQITATLSVNGKTQTVSAQSPEKAGIFHLTLTPATAGKGTLTYIVKAGNIADTLLIHSVEVFSDEHTAQHEAEEHAIMSSTAIVFTKEQSWRADFATDYPQQRPFAPAVQTVAQVQPAVGDMMSVVAKHSGLLKFASSNLVEGREIQQGATLASIVSDGFIENNLSTQIAEAKNNMEIARQNYERVQSLVQNKIVSQQEFLEIQNKYENAKIAYENLTQNSRGGNVSITAPIGGFITQIWVQNGEYVSVGQPIMEISKNRNIVLKAEIPQRYAAMLPTIADANIENPISGETLSLKELNGRILSYGRTLPADKFLMPVVLEISQAGGFTSGAFAKVWLSPPAKEQAMVIPKTALIEEQGNYYVFIQLTPELFEKTPVKIGATDGQFVEILSGINRSQRIVTKGTMLVKLAKSSAAIDPHAGHVH